MKNETKNTEKTNTGEAKPKFQQPEPAELNEADLQVVAGGALRGQTDEPSSRCCSYSC